jgi:hypothetical protein
MPAVSARLDLSFAGDFLPLQVNLACLTAEGPKSPGKPKSTAVPARQTVSPSGLIDGSSMATTGAGSGRSFL